LRKRKFRRKVIDGLRLKYEEAKAKPMTDSTKLFWVVCRVCNHSWVAVQKEIDESDICHKHHCQNSFEAKVINAVSKTREILPG
jgi:hypothetical protein